MAIKLTKRQTLKISKLSSNEQAYVKDLTAKDWFDRYNAVVFIGESKKIALQDKIKLIKKMTADGQSQIRKIAVSWLFALTPKKRLAEIKKYYNNQYKSDAHLGLEEAKVKLNGLYQINEFENNFKNKTRNVVRRKQTKTGSRTIVLGGKLYKKATIRIIQKSALAAWVKALTAKEIWKKVGFNYVPIEPILMKNGKYRAYKHNKQNYRVSTKVLQGISLAEFIANPTNKSKYDECLKMQQKIIAGLTQLKIEHGHVHNNNFIVVNTNAGLRLYLIDFDAVRIIA